MIVWNTMGTPSLVTGYCNYTIPATTTTTTTSTSYPTTSAPSLKASKLAGVWTLNSCSPSYSVTCRNYYPYTLQKYIVADDLAGTLYAVPYNVKGSVVSFSYVGYIVSLPGYNGKCEATWNTFSNTVYPTCRDGTTLSISCTAGPCRSTLTTPSNLLEGEYTRTTSCTQYNAKCSDFFDTKYTAVNRNGMTALKPNSSNYLEAVMYTYSDGSMMIASSSSLCYARRTYSFDSTIRIICGYSPLLGGGWAEADFRCSAGSCNLGQKVIDITLPVIIASSVGGFVVFILFVVIVVTTIVFCTRRRRRLAASTVQLNNIPLVDTDYLKHPQDSRYYRM